MKFNSIFSQKAFMSGTKLKRRLAFVLFFLSSVTLWSQVITKTFTTSGDWTAPCGVTSVKVEMWGGGGGGGYRDINSASGTPGGGGGAYSSKILTVVPKQTYNYKIGIGGAKGNNNTVKNGGETTFSTSGQATALLTANGGKGALANSTNTNNGKGGAASTGTGITSFKGGDGGLAYAEPRKSGGGGGAASPEGPGGNASADTVGLGQTQWIGGTSMGSGGSGGNGAADPFNSINNVNGQDGLGFGGGGGGGWNVKNNIAVLGGAGAPGGIIITYELPTLVAATSITAVGGTNIGCVSKSVELKSNSLSPATGLSTLWYEGAICPTFAFINEMTETQVTSNTQLPTVFQNGNRKFKANSNDPMIHLETAFPNGIDFAKYKYITVRYRAVSPSPNPQAFEVYIKKGSLVLAEDKVVRAPINIDGIWHISNIDMSGNSNWNVQDGSVTGIRFDYATISGTELEIDYIILGDSPILENTNADDSTINVTPSSMQTTYGTLRISEAVPCNGLVPVSSCATQIIKRIDKNFVGSGTWNDVTKWLPGNTVPTIQNCVFIPSESDLNVNVSDAVAKEITILPGGKLNINKTLTVNDGITNFADAGKFVLQNNGNLLQINPIAVNSGSITVERRAVDMNNVDGVQMDYVYWSSPVQSQSLQGFSPGTPANRIFEYNESTDLFKAVKLANEPNFIPGKGYAIRAEVNLDYPADSAGYEKTYQFVGKPNNGDIYFPVKRSPNTGAGQSIVHGYNLIGNPYPSNIDFKQFYDLNSSKIYNTAWFWTNNTYTKNQQAQGYLQNNYAVFNGTGGVGAPSSAAGGTGNTTIPTGIVSVGQGFIVQVKDIGNTTVKFQNKNGGSNLRVNTSGTFFNKNENTIDRYWLNLISPDNLINSQLIGYVNGATDGFEQDFDAEALSLSSDLFYSQVVDKKLVIQGRSKDFNKTDKVKLGANFFAKGEYTITLKQPEGIFEEQSIYLKDNDTGIITNLKEGSYVFLTEAGQKNNRFEIIYENDNVLVSDSSIKESVVVYRDSDNFIVKSPKMISVLEVLDMSGKLISLLEPNSKESEVQASSLPNGIYLLVIRTKDGQITTKKISK